MRLVRVRPLDEVVEVAGEELAGREERKRRRAKRARGRSRRQKKRARRLKGEADLERSGRKRRSSGKSKSSSRRRSKSSGESARPRSRRPSSAQEVPYQEPLLDEPTWPEEEFEEDFQEDFEDEPYEEEFDEDFQEEFDEGYDDEEADYAGVDLAGRKGKKKSVRRWSRPALVGRLRIQARKGSRAAIRELEPGLYLVAEVRKGKLDQLKRLREASLAGDVELGALGLLARLASNRALQLLRRGTPETTQAPSPTTPVTTPVSRSEPAHPWYPQPPAGVGGAVVTQSGDTLWSLAQTHLGSGLSWVQIFSLNTERLSGALATTPLPAGQVLWLPQAPGGSWLNRDETP
jgi:nucleoid-associated protein YgaU